MHNSQLHVQVESYNYSWNVLPPNYGGGGEFERGWAANLLQLREM